MQLPIQSILKEMPKAQSSQAKQLDTIICWIKNNLLAGLEGDPKNFQKPDSYHPLNHCKNLLLQTMDLGAHTLMKREQVVSAKQPPQVLNSDSYGAFHLVDLNSFVI